jgi:hypothetical protein
LGFAFTPLLDQANHAPQPNSDFKPSADGGAYELVDVADIAAGSEVAISYSPVRYAAGAARAWAKVCLGGAWGGAGGYCLLSRMVRGVA